MFLDQASSYAADIDQLILLVTVLVGFWFFLAEAVFFGLIWKFRAKEGQKALYITGKEPQYKKWINRAHTAVLICDVFIIVGSVRVWYHVKQEQPEPDYEVRVIAQQWAWSFQHPGADKQLDTPDDIFTVEDMYVEVDKTYSFKLVSLDVMHDFSVPVFRLKQDAIPGRTITGWFKPTKTGDYLIQCAEMCGIGHGIMAGRIHILDSAGHDAWIADNTSVAAN